jgi:hypothetical protein
VSGIQEKTRGNPDRWWLVLVVMVLVMAAVVVARLFVRSPQPPQPATPPPTTSEATPPQIVPAAPQPKLFVENFSEGRLDLERWAIISDGDFHERTIDVVDRGEAPAHDYRLRLRADTLGTRDETVKFLGVRTVKALPVGEGARITCDLDWNNQANGCYLSAAFVLSPEKTDGNPLTNHNWVKVEYIGVPPGENARVEIKVCRDDQVKTLEAEGWPEKNRTGRRIGLQKLELMIRNRTLQVSENGAQIYRSTEPVLPFDEAYLYCQMSSHSNYPARQVYFSNISVSSEK